MENENSMDPVVEEGTWQYRINFLEDANATNDIQKVLDSQQNTALDGTQKRTEQWDDHTVEWWYIVHVDHDDDDRKDVWRDTTWWRWL